MLRIVVVTLAVSACGRVGFEVVVAPDGRVAIDALVAIDARSAVVDLDGGKTWGGWTRVAGSQQTGFWVAGNTDRTYDFYTTSFVLDAAQTVTAATLGATEAGDGIRIAGDVGDLFDGNWQAGDRIAGIGLAYSGATRLSRLFWQFDYAGDSIMPASSFGAADGVLTFNAGDTASYFTSDTDDVPDRFREYQYSVFTAFSSDGGSNFTVAYGGPLPTIPAGPDRSFVILDVGSTQLATSGQFLHDFDAELRLNGGVGNGEGTCGPHTNLAFEELDLSNGDDNSQQVFPIAACL